MRESMMMHPLNRLNVINYFAQGPTLYTQNKGMVGHIAWSQHLKTFAL